MNTWVDTKELDQFRRHWDALFDVFPAARQAAVAEMGAAVRRDLDANILSQGVDDLFCHVRNSQRLALGSKGGYAAIRAEAMPFHDRFGKRKTWKGKNVSGRMVTRWLERGHGARRPSGQDTRYRARIVGAGVSGRGAYVKGHLFYSWTKLKAWEHARRAADKVLSRLADEIDY